MVWRVELPSPTPDLDADSIKLFSESLAGDPLPGDYPAQVRRAATAMRGGGFEPLDLDAGLRLDSDLRDFHTVFFLLTSADLREYNCGTFAASGTSSHKTRE